MAEAAEVLARQLDSLALDSVMLEPGDIPRLGQFLKSLDAIELSLGDVKEESLRVILAAMKQYTESVIMGEKTDMTPVGSAISLLQEICRDLAGGKKSQRDISPLLASLGHGGSTSALEQGQEEAAESTEREGEARVGDSDSREGAEERSSAGSVTADEDLEIIADFVAESMEHLGTIEAKLMDLEQDPSNPDTINDIFRPFHTIKGVSGFLNFSKINNLAHVSENLLDMARNGSLGIDEEVVDLVLSSVDMLKKMIQNLRDTMEKGKPSEGDMDTDSLVSRIRHFISQAQGEHRPLGEILETRGKISGEDIENALSVQKTRRDMKIGEILVDQKKVKAGDVISALREQKKFKQPVALQVKIDTAKLDNVVDMAGELAIAQSMLRQNEVIRTSKDRALDRITNRLNQITSGLQRTAMSLRMVPIRNTFEKMLR
ncbi:MAG: Hpt domain-containing protein, partial [Deltaproteobacteria bacterium]|nr:Hpt domain-containing protein [Deltaproteobacteria bacterium]